MAYEYEDATVRYNDYKGTAAADDADFEQEDLYKLAGIDEKLWWIVGR